MERKYKPKDNIAEKQLPCYHDAYGKEVYPAEYMLVLQPHEDLCNKIHAVKKEFGEAFNVNTASTTRPGIALVRYTQYEMQEQHLYNRLKTLSAALPAFKIDLGEFGSYPSHTIFIKVLTQEPVKAITQKLREAQSLMTINKEFKPLFFNEPHITIAAKLLPWQYEKGWQEYSQRHFQGSFIAEQLLLLKRRHGHNSWKVLSNFYLLNQPVETKQGDLFG